MVNICPVCGFLMRYPARDWNICPSCGTEFGYDDAGRTHAELRHAWIDRGMQWWSPVESPPDGWNALEQLNNVVVFRQQIYIVPLSYNNNTNTGIPAISATWIRRTSNRERLTPPPAEKMHLDLTGLLR